MIIQNSTVALSASHTKLSRTTSKDNLQFWVSSQNQRQQIARLNAQVTKVQQTVQKDSSSNKASFSSSNSNNTIKNNNESKTEISNPLPDTTDKPTNNSEIKTTPIVDKHDFGFQIPPLQSTQTIKPVAVAQQLAKTNNLNNQSTATSNSNNNNNINNDTFINGLTKPFKRVSASTLNGNYINSAVKKSEDDDIFNDTSLSPEMRMIAFLYERLTGKKMKITKMEDFQKFQNDANNKINQIQQNNLQKTQDNINKVQQQQTSQAPAPVQQGWGLQFTHQDAVYQSEDTNFSANGVVKTSDGKEINFSLDLQMKSEYYQEQNVNINLGDSVSKDPLVINYDGTAVQLTDKKFQFDLNSDGQKDNISFVGSGSGFLVFDKNNDGKVNNGTELFGASTGNGFKELSAYDNDKNGWIDENDSIYNKLEVWSKDTQGNDSLSKLKQKSIGAIYLQNTQTTFDIKNQNNQKQGDVASTGVYLNENGSAGTVQQLNLVI